MSTDYNPYTSELVGRLIKMSHADSRAWFSAIRDHLMRFHGVASLHDFIRGCSDEKVRMLRFETLSLICRAIRDEDISLLNAPPVSAGEQAAHTQPPAVSP